MKKINKKALTPLMTTFLLLSFAVAVSVVVINLGSAEIENIAQCAIDINLEIATINNEGQICYDASYVGHLQYNPLIDGTIRQIKIIPKIIPYDLEVICPDKSLIIEAVNPCGAV